MLLDKISFRKIVKYIVYYLSVYCILKLIIRGECADKILISTTISTCVFVILDIVCPLVNICKCSKVKMT
jgi:hypothetical protein